MMQETPEVFQPPPEALIFEPTLEEFEDPIAFITRIRPQVERTGICKIRPPADWQPPFVVDVESFKFVPRMQKINELEATSRVKLNFLDKLLKFWDLQGTSIKIPTVDRKLLDFHKLHKTVQSEGGYDTVVRERKWSKVAFKMNLNDPATGKCNGSVLRGHYEKYLYPFDLFEAGITVDQNALKEELKRDEELEKSDSSITKSSPATSSSDTSLSAAGSPSAIQRGRKRKEDKFIKTYSKSPKKDAKVPDIDYSANSEMRKLQFFGAGPKTVVPLQISKATEKTDMTLATPATPPPPAKVEPELIEEQRPSSATDFAAKERKDKKWKMRDRSGNWRANYLEGSMCVQCERSNNDQQMLVCDGCDDAYHMYCLVPPLIDMPKGDWRCPKCVAKECNKPKAAYGFEQAKRQFSLQEFGEMADQFKADYFQKPAHTVPCSEVEREFWRLTTSLEEDVTVNYGADIHALTMGSGFPTEQTKDLLPGDEKYITSSWNLNNLPVHEKSILKYVTGDVSGMKVPWCYVGMCFSSFCWHIEDHWSYSVNYHHWGEPKTWYGVPSSHGQQLEEVMKSRAPELFEQSPDLLHHITTIMNPNLLMSQGIPIVRTDQCAGEFIITFPRAYHAGFNQGYNFAEAVNFCPADWLPFGRECIGQYKLVKRLPVFSHEELICKMAADPDSMDLQLAAQTHNELLAIVDFERKHRLKLLDMGIYQAEQEAFELVPDDERQCCYCKTTCFMSAITCPCKPDAVACVEHAAQLCGCPGARKCLRYRYTLEEMPHMINQLKKRAEFYDSWSQRAKSAISATGQDRLELSDLKKLILEAKEKRYPDTGMMKSIQKVVNEVEKCASLATQLVNRNLRQPLQPTTNLGDKRTKLSLEELEHFAQRMDSLPCVIKESSLIMGFIQRVEEFQAEAQACISDEIPPTDKLERLYQFGCTLDLDLMETPKLKQALAQSRWLDDVRCTLEKSSSLGLDNIRELMERASCLAPHTAVDKSLAELQDLIVSGEKWEEKARICLQARPRHVISTIEVIINEARSIPANLPNVATLKGALKKAKEWIMSVEAIHMADHYPYLDVLEEMVNKGRPIPVRLEPLPQIESQVTAAKSWRERTARTFLKKNCTYSLLEVLSPRSDIGLYPTTKKRKKKDIDSLPTLFDKPDKQYADPAQMVESFKNSELIELESMRAIRAKNLEKHRQEDSADLKYCLCRKGPSGYMFQCEMCKDWFHGHCVPIFKPSSVKNKSAQPAWLQAARENKFLCPFCLRSRRPRLETILGLLVSLQKLPIRLAEGEALQCLTERAMAWQDKARQVLQTEELTSVMTRISALSQRMVEQAAKEKTQKIIDAELQKAAGKPELQGQFTSSNISASLVPVVIEEQLAPIKCEPGELKTEISRGAAPDIITINLESSYSDRRSQPLVDVKSCTADISEHAYSTVSKANHSKAAGSLSNTSMATADSPRKHLRKSPLIPRSMSTSSGGGGGGPLMDLSDLARAQLEELMMEGDLLEVSLDETQQIWKVLHACNNRTADDRILRFEERDMEFTKPSTYVKKEKKRKIKQEPTPNTTAVAPPPPPPAPPSAPLIKRRKKEPFKLRATDMMNPSLNMKRQKKEGMKHRKSKGIKLPTPVSTPVVPLGDAKKGPPPKMKKVKRRKMKSNQMRKAMSVDMVTGTVEEEEDCSASKCLKPSGDEVDWVQCDKCEQWFHLTCLGLSKIDVSADDDFVCSLCGQDQMMNIGAGDQPYKIIDTEEIISVVSTPIPSASQSPTNDGNSSGGEAGDGPRIKVTSANQELDDVELTTTIVRPDDCNLDVDIEGDDRPAASEDGGEASNTEVVIAAIE